MESRPTPLINLILAIFLYCCGSMQLSYANAVVVSFEGCVEQKKTLSYKSKVSLLQLIQDAKITDCGYVLGGSLLQEDLVPVQKLQKQSLLKSINSFIRVSRDSSDTDYLLKLHNVISSHKVSGRLVGLDIEPFHVEILPLKNRIITSKSLLHIPKQPIHINLIGFNQSQHVYDSDQTINDIYERYDICKSCKHGWVILVQPNGEIEHKKVGYWTNQKDYLAPGGWMISPLHNSLFEKINPNFNRTLAEWLATQVIK